MIQTTYLQDRNKITDVESKFIVIGGKRNKLGYWEPYIHTNIYTIDN